MVDSRGTLPWSWIVDDVIDDRDRFDWLTIYDWRSIKSWSRSTNIDDRRSTQTLMIDDRRWKTHKSFFVTFLQKHQKDLLSVAVKTQKCHFFFEHHIFSAIFHKSIGKDVERRKKGAIIVLTVFERNFAFENFGLLFWEYNWLTTNNSNQNDWERCWKKNKKQQMLWPLSSSKSSLLRTSGFISEKKNELQQTKVIKMIGKDVEWRPKTANTVPTVFEQKFAF